MKYKMLWVILSFTLIIGMVLFSCSGPDEPTYGSGHPDPNPTGMTAPKVDSLSPNAGYLKDIIKIYGSGFNSTPEYNLVSFGKNVGKIMDATSTMLTVQTPNIANDTVDVRVSIKGSEYWSKETPFIFKNTLETIDEEIVWPMGVEADDDGNVYVGSVEDGVIYKITPDGAKSEFASLPIEGSIGWGPDNYLYACEMDEGKIVRISPDGSVIEDVVEVDGAVDFDWAQNGNMYIIQNWGEGISMFDGTTVTQVSDYGEELKSGRIFGDNLYVSDIWNDQILKFPITTGGLGDYEVVYEGEAPVGIEFDSEGTMYFTRAWETSLYTLKEDGTEEVLYDGELLTPMRYITFHGKKMYIVFPGWGDVGTTISAYIGVEQAPNYGLQ